MPAYGIHKSKSVWFGLLLVSSMLTSSLGTIEAEESYYENDDYYISSQLWEAGGTVYSMSTTFLKPGRWPVGTTACVSGGISVYQGYWNGIRGAAACAEGEATVSTSAPRQPYSYATFAEHGANNWNTTIGYTNVFLDLGQPIINYFYASPTRITPPQTTTIYYSFDNWVTANINGTALTQSTGSLTVSPTTTTTYTLTISTYSSTQQVALTVWVNPPLNPLFYRHSVHHEKGSSPFFPFLSLQSQSVNSANGNLIFQIPISSRPGRNGLGVNLALMYNSKIWDFYAQGGSLYATLAESDSWVGAGWTLLVGRVIDDSANGHYYITLPDGSNHDLINYGGAWRSIDSTYMIYDPPAFKLTLKGGMKIFFNHVDQLRPYSRYATRVQDTSGNYYDIAYADYGGRISTIQDTLGNTYTFLLNSNGWLQYIRCSLSGGGYTTTTLNY